MEAGNRCYDDRVPEEVNRRVIDHSSTRADALHAAQPGEPAARGHRRGERIYVTGNPIHEVLEHYAAQIDASTVLRAARRRARALLPGRRCTAPRTSTSRRGCASLAAALEQVQPRVRHARSSAACTRARAARCGSSASTVERRARPLPRAARVLRLRGAGAHGVLRALATAARCRRSAASSACPPSRSATSPSGPRRSSAAATCWPASTRRRCCAACATVTAAPPAWTPPPEYLAPDVSSAVVKIVLGYLWAGRQS